MLIACAPASLVLSADEDKSDKESRSAVGAHMACLALDCACGHSSLFSSSISPSCRLWSAALARRATKSRVTSRASVATSSTALRVSSDAHRSACSPPLATRDGCVTSAPACRGLDLRVASASVSLRHLLGSSTGPRPSGEHACAFAQPLPSCVPGPLRTTRGLSLPVAVACTRSGVPVSPRPRLLPSPLPSPCARTAELAPGAPSTGTEFWPVELLLTRSECPRITMLAAPWSRPPAAPYRVASAPTRRLAD